MYLIRVSLETFLAQVDGLLSEEQGEAPVLQPQKGRGPSTALSHSTD